MRFPLEVRVKPNGVFIDRAETSGFEKNYLPTPPAMYCILWKSTIDSGDVFSRDYNMAEEK